MTRHCHAITKKGKRCNAPPTSDSDYCIAHDKKKRESLGFGGSQPTAGRPRMPRVVDHIRVIAEEQKDTLTQVLIDALTAEAPVVVGHGPGAHVVMVADHRVRIAALREFLDRAYGKPKQTQELTGAGGAPLMPTVLLDDPKGRAKVEELRALLAERSA